MKKWYKSKLIWLGIITLIFNLLKFFGVISLELTAELQTTILSVLVIIFRLFTKDPLFEFE